MKKNFIINVSILYLASFILLYLITTLTTKIVATWLFDIPTDFHRWGLIFTIADNSPKWDHASIIGIYIIGPAMAGFLAAFSVAYFFSKVFHYRSIFKLFVIFLYMHAVNMIFGGLLIGIFLKAGFGYVPRWLGFEDTLLYIIAGISFLLLILNGFLLNSYMAAYGYTKDQYNEDKDQLKFKLIHFVLPIIFISSIMFFIGIPDNSLYLRLINLTFLLQIPGLLLFKFIPNDPKKNFALRIKVSRIAVYTLAFFVTILILIAI